MARIYQTAHPCPNVSFRWYLVRSARLASTGIIYNTEEDGQTYNGDTKLSTVATIIYLAICSSADSIHQPGMNDTTHQCAAFLSGGSVWRYIVRSARSARLMIMGAICNIDWYGTYLPSFIWPYPTMYQNDRYFKYLIPYKTLSTAVSNSPIFRCWSKGENECHCH